MKVSVRLATLADVPAIVRVCSEGWRDTYRNLHSPEYIEDVVARFYNLERIASEIGSRDDWDGWLVAEMAGQVIGASGGGKTGEKTWEVFVLYLDPSKRRQGAGRALLNAMTSQALAHGAIEQWVDVTQDNQKGLPFYEVMGFEVRERREVRSRKTGEPVRSFRMARLLRQEIVGELR
ncbi:GNAT family N-acetyltransferase [Deinococcus planocerae]|uniref:GNAT family N-acetyltransferase n=1 Tax=Deinococcus planocerae TaxID=1737569 RepID=UPI001C6411F6|nr:GNAT family N-acetyltransferase [Deinococcus planocerae]